MKKLGHTEYTDLCILGKENDIETLKNFERNQFIDKSTNQDIFESLKGRYIHVSPPIDIKRFYNSCETKIYERCNVKDLVTDKYDDEEEYKFQWNMHLSGLWFADGLSYMLSLGGSKFRGKGKNEVSAFWGMYLFPKGKKITQRTHIYEVIPSEETSIFDAEKYEEFKKFTDENEIDLNQFHINEIFDGEYWEADKLGVIWRFSPGFKLRLLYVCTSAEILNKDLGTYTFYLEPKLDSKNLVCSKSL